MTTSKHKTRRRSIAFALAGVSLAAFVQTACSKAPDQASVPPGTEATVTAAPAVPDNAAAGQSANAPTPSASLVVAAPTDIKAPPSGTIIPPDPNQAAKDNADNAKVADLAKRFASDPSALERQNAACGAADQVVNNVYILAQGAVTDEMRRFRVACMAKDRAREDAAKRDATAGGGVKNTGSL